MNMIARLIVVVGAALGAYALSYWPFNILLYAAFKGHPQFLDVAPKVLALIFAVTAAWVAWKKLRSADPGIFSYMLIGAFLFGLIGFLAGSFSVHIFYTDNNLAGLIPIVYTGPLGFLVGGIAGCFYWWTKRSKHTTSITDSQRKYHEPGT